jgi:hypothetical protein
MSGKEMSVNGAIMLAPEIINNGHCNVYAAQYVVQV